MCDREQDKQKLFALHHNKECTINWFEEGGALVQRVYDVFVLFECGQYGGEPRYAGTFTERQLDDLLDMAYSWS